MALTAQSMHVQGLLCEAMVSADKGKNVKPHHLVSYTHAFVISRMRQCLAAMNNITWLILNFCCVIHM